ncbi:cell division protein FtsB [Motiliproteus coralliicola]|uniref:Cell division protein FtsB n=1 Tax=Motiliproteus coralliicola TaxID=2283196 RepID=A0A369WJW9_9GAMM|nr:cell division protein FtsB [Motiliproteus coralliicola]RDE22340.1 cell division protein FtsB [Motiliproteus coralliicola]
MKWLLALLILLLAGLQYRLWFGDGNLPSVWALQDSIEQQQDSNQALIERNEALRAEVDDLREGTSAMEERARSELGMIKRGETFFLLPESETSQQ